ncbi:disease resistance protein RUN1 [Lactuca sativa]|nr:disease resistance protein RUN1 [Lactuca sativa]
MASSSSSPSAPALSSQSWKYHVFLSFRGEDTRNTFVGHLYSALEQQGIYTYKDNETLPQGESIHPSLMKAIEESQIAIIVFSKNYCDSLWCLDELAHIMKCRDTRSQIVMPIFYDVDPSEIRKQKQKYGEAFAKHELENKRKVESWRKALVDASNISGWEPKHIANGHEPKGIKQIVAEISQKLHRGVGGGGKTTLASSIYDEICRQFDGCCFVQNIREESSRYGLGKLEGEILSKMGVNNVGGGRCMIKDRLCHKKVLIVLDDVDHLEQLKTLAGSHDWFGEGSLIIITTRDKHLLAAHQVNVMHNISLLNSDEAMKLFCKHAPQDNRPLEDYQQLSKEVVSYAGGLPLALTVLGSFLRDKDINEWRSALARLKEIPDSDILEKLKISFDGLKLVEKELFLDIACFFRREDKDKAMRILEACGFHPVIGVKVLIQKALITISYGLFDMHDLVQEMGHHIVRGEHPNNPEKHSRLWKKEDIFKICAMDATTELDMIEAIRFEYSSKDQLQRHKHHPAIVANTKNLRWIDWEGDLANPFLSNFPQKTLCCLRLNNSLQRQLWEGYKLLPNLKTIELRSLRNLITIPDFDGIANLEKFVLSGCLYLEEIHPSIGGLERLVSLSISSCFNLKRFPPIPKLQKLEILSFTGCSKLFKFSEIQEENMENLPCLDFDNRRKEVASYIESCANFFVNCWRCCCSNIPGVEWCSQEPLAKNNMKTCLRDNNMNNIGLQFCLRDLRELDLSYCRLGDENMSSAVWELPNLQKLDLSRNKFSRLNLSPLRLPRLKCIDVSCCKNLVELSDLPSSIAVVIADGCKSLESFGDISNCKWLWKVSLWRGNKFFGYILLDSMIQGNASEDYFISFIIEHQIPKVFIGRLFRGRTFTPRLPDDWYNDFCGFLICVVVNQMPYPDIDIVIKQEVDEDSLFELWQEPNEVIKPEFDKCTTYIGYVSFGSLRHTGF